MRKTAKKTSALRVRSSRGGVKTRLRPEATLGLENYSAPDFFGKWLGYELVHMDRKNFRAETELLIREDHISSAKKVHGGVISAFLDFSCGAAVFSTMEPRDFCSTVEIKVNYLRPLNLLDCLTAKTAVIFRGKRLCVVHGYVYRQGEKRPVAMASATFNIISAV